MNSRKVVYTVPSSNRWLSPGLSIGLDYGRELWFVHSFESAGKSDRTPFRTRHEYIHVGSDASSLTHTVLKEVRSLFPARARLRREKPPGQAVEQCEPLSHHLFHGMGDLDFQCGTSPSGARALLPGPFETHMRPP